MTANISDALSSRREQSTDPSYLKVPPPPKYLIAVMEIFRDSPTFLTPEALRRSAKEPKISNKIQDKSL